MHLDSLQRDQISPGLCCMVAHMCAHLTLLESLNLALAALVLDAIGDLIYGGTYQKSPQPIEFHSFYMFLFDKIILKRCISPDHNMPSYMGSITITNWLQEQIWREIDQLLMFAQHT